MGVLHVGQGTRAKVLTASALSGVLHWVHEITDHSIKINIYMQQHNRHKLPNYPMTFFWSIGVLKISECRLRISDFECAICLIFQSAIRNLKSAINFTPSLHGKNLT
jgi:hypothetical protein